MRLSVLVIIDDPQHAPAVLGRSIIEHQVMRSIAAGAQHAACIVPQVSSATLNFTDRLRKSGISVDIVRSLAAAADTIHPDETAIVVASPAIASSEALRSLVDISGPALLCIARSDAPESFEVIDAQTRWTGFAACNGQTLRDVSNLVGDWDVASTLLRQLVQNNARRVVVESHDDMRFITAGDRQSAILAGRWLLVHQDNPGAGLGDRWVGNPVSGGLAQLFGEHGVAPKPLGVAASGLAIVAALGAIAGWIGLAVLTLLVARLLRAVANRLENAFGTRPDPRGIVTRIDSGGSGVAALAIGAQLVRATGQWGYALLSALLVASIALRSRLDVHRPWFADQVSILVVVLTGFVLGIPLVGCLLVTGHALASYGCAADQA